MLLLLTWMAIAGISLRLSTGNVSKSAHLRMPMSVSAIVTTRYQFPKRAERSERQRWPNGGILPPRHDPARGAAMGAYSSVVLTRRRKCAPFFAACGRSHGWRRQVAASSTRNGLRIATVFNGAQQLGGLWILQNLKQRTRGYRRLQNIYEIDSVGGRAKRVVQITKRIVELGIPVQSCSACSPTPAPPNQTRGKVPSHRKRAGMPLTCPATIFDFTTVGVRATATTNSTPLCHGCRSNTGINKTRYPLKEGSRSPEGY